MENRLMLKFSNMFQSCQSKNNSDVRNQPFFFPENHYHRQQLVDLFSPKPQSFSRPKPHHPGPKTSDKNPLFPVCRKPQKTTKKKPQYRNPKKIQNFTSATDNYYYDWRSSDEEDEFDDETTLFSSRSFSSDSSESFRKNRAHRKSVNKSKRIDGAGDLAKNLKDSEEKSGNLVNDSFAVVKKSSNPHEDFRVSMVEMIVEKQIFGAEELENLLECFISLNSEEHHRVIIEVFTQIWDALFSD